MTDRQTFYLINDHVRSNAIAAVINAPAGSVISIGPEKRSLNQNALLWAMLSDLSRAKPEGRTHTPEVWKQLVMHACGHAVQFEIGLNGQPFPTGFRSSRMTKAQMSDLIEWIMQYGDEHGVQWSNEAKDEAA